MSQDVASTNQETLLKMLPCPLCRCEGEFLSARTTHTDYHIQKYGKLYEGKELSEWKVCSQCGFLHQNPRPTAEALNQFYLRSEYHDTKTNPETRESYLHFAEWYYSEKTDFILSLLQKAKFGSRKVFDIGFGYGGFLKQFADRGWETYGVEADQVMFDFAQRELALPHLKKGILDKNIELESRVGLVISNHAFEHFAELDDVMKGICNILEPGGYVFTVVPTYYKNRSRLSKLWMNSSHYSLFTHRSLNQLMARYGFEEVTHSYRGWLKEVDDLWHVARFTGKPKAAESFYENGRSVQFYVNVINPLRTILLYLVYSNWAARVAFFGRWRHRVVLLVRQPNVAFSKIFGRLRS